MRSTTYAVATVLGAACFCIIALRFLPVPFFWIGLIWGISGFVIAALATDALRLSITVGACVPVALGLGELVFPPVIHWSEVPSPFREDALLGWSLNPSQVTHATADVEGEPIYDVMYTTDRAGFRVAPSDRGDQVEGCLLFLSDSFTFGHGVGDDQTFPYQVGLQTNGRFRVLNRAVPGYGAEQMLAAIQKGGLATDLPCEPTHIFYVALPHHVLRAAHKTTFSEHGPRYRLDVNGVPEYVGTNPRQNANLETNDRAMQPETWPEWLELTKTQLRKWRILPIQSRIFRALLVVEPPTTEADIDLYFAIVREAFRLFERRWPKAELHVISWDLRPFFANGQDRFHRGLETIDTQVHFIDEILPGYGKDPGEYGIHPQDLHPNALAHRLIASYLSERILSPARLVQSQDNRDETKESSQFRP